MGCQSTFTLRRLVNIVASAIGPRAIGPFIGDVPFWISAAMGADFLGDVVGHRNNHSAALIMPGRGRTRISREVSDDTILLKFPPI